MNIKKVLTPICLVVFICCFAGSALAASDCTIVEYADNTIHFDKTIHQDTSYVTVGQEFYIGDAVDEDRGFYKVCLRSTGGLNRVEEPVHEDGICYVKLAAKRAGTYEVTFKITEKESGNFRGLATATIVVKDALKSCNQPTEDDCNRGARYRDHGDHRDHRNHRN